MTVTLDHLPQYDVMSSADRRAQHRQAEATRRRQEALARLARRRMPLPGQAGPTQPLRPKSLRVAPVVVPVEAPAPRVNFTLVTDEDQTGSGGRCGCASASAEERPALTEREIEVMRAWLLLDTKPAVAQELFISLGTVNTHLTRIRAKYTEVGRPAPTKAALVARAVQDGLISLEEL